MARKKEVSIKENKTERGRLLTLAFKHELIDKYAKMMDVYRVTIHKLMQIGTLFFHENSPLTCVQIQ